MKTLSCLSAACALAAGFAVVQSPPQEQGPSKKPLQRWCALLEVGPGYDKTKLPMQQTGFGEHIANVNKLASDGTLLVGGPLFGADLAAPLSGGVWIFEAADEAAAKKLVEEDAFVKGGQMKLVSVRAFMAGAGAWIAAPKSPAAATAPAGR